MNDGPDHQESRPDNCVDQLAIEMAMPGREPPQHQVDSTKPFHIRFRWRVADRLTPGLDGTFHLRAFAESFGIGYAGAIGQTHAPAEPGRQDYTAGILVPPGALPPGSHDDPDPDRHGMYRITGVLQYQDRSGTTISSLSVTTALLVIVR